MPRVDLLGIAEDSITYHVSNPDNQLHRVSTVEARKDLAEVLNRVNKGNQRIILTRRDWDLLSLIPAEAFERYLLVDAIEDEIDSQLPDEEAIRAEGDLVSWEEFKKELNLE
jgi:PHD/YefM family antitoxin component YafN of YafNO toxin-antitoxin module